MSDLNEMCLDTFPSWLRSLGEDVEAVLAAAESAELDEDSKRLLIAGVNYLFKSLDLIPDGIDDIGYLDDAFVLRVAASLAVSESSGDDTLAAVTGLGEQTALVKEFLGDETFDRLVRYTKELRQSSARGRSVTEIISNEDIWREFASEVRNFSKSYESPAFSREEKNLIKLRAFFDAKLPR